MFNKRRTDYVSTITLISIVLLFVEIAFFNSGVVFSGFLSALCDISAIMKIYQRSWDFIGDYQNISAIPRFYQRLTIFFQSANSPTHHHSQKPKTKNPPYPGG